MMIFCGARMQGANFASLSAMNGPFAASAFCRPARFLPAITSSVLIGTFFAALETSRILSPIFTPSPVFKLQSVSERGSVEPAACASPGSMSLLAIAAAPIVLSNVRLVGAMFRPPFQYPSCCWRGLPYLSGGNAGGCL